MILLWGYLIYLVASMIFAIVAARMAVDRATLSGSSHCQACLVVAWYDFWCGAFYDRKLHRVYLFPIPMFGICVDFDAPPISGE